MCKLSYRYKYRIYPNSHQETLMNKTLELCRYVYNETLAYRKDKYEKENISISKYDTNKLLPIWKIKNIQLQNIHSQVLADVQERVDLAFRFFFQRAKKGQTPGYPRFKGVGNYDSFCYPQISNGATRIKENKLYLSKIGSIKIELHREIPESCKIKRITIKRESNKWFAIFSCEENQENKIHNKENIVGIDLGCKNFITLSDGNQVENPKFLKQSMKKIKRYSRKLSEKKKGSPERIKTKKVLNQVYKKIKNQRSDFLHKVSKNLTDNYKNIVFEDLNINSMIENKPWTSLNRSILDSGWGIFVNFCIYKAERAGGRVIKVNPKNTTKMCSRCGNLIEKDLSERIHRCSCGLEIDRDLNASINILRLGQKSLAKSLEVK